MTEGTLLAACRRKIKELFPDAVIIKHADSVTSGVPDLSCTYNGMTSWWEFKQGPKIKWKNALQELTCRRLAHHGTCYVVLYEIINDVKRTVILRPDEIEIASVSGFDHVFVAEIIREAHR